MSDQQVYLQRIEDERRFSFESSNPCSPNREICFLCRRAILQDDDTGWWYLEDESGWVPTHKSDFTPAYETQAGWVCSTDCFNDHAIDAEEL